MGIFSRFKSLFKSKDISHTDNSLPEFSIFKTETPEKIIETRIKPIKIPTILDLGEKLSHLSSHISSLKEDVVTKSWFLNQYEDASNEILNSLNDINKIVYEIKDILTDTKNLSKNLSDVSNKRLNASDMILNVLKKNEKLRFRDIVSLLPFSDPTISKHIKILLNNNKIKRTKIGKAAFYELVNP